MPAKVLASMTISGLVTWMLTAWPAIAWIYGYDSAAAVETGDLGLPPRAN